MDSQRRVTIDEMKNEEYIREKKDQSIVLPNKKDSFDNYTDKRIMSIQKKLNERPREKLNFSTPKCEFFKHVL